MTLGKTLWLTKVLALRMYRRIFARPRWRRLNAFLYHLSLRGLGVLNYESDAVSGERWFLTSYLHNRQAPLVLDVGANVGAFSASVLEICPAARIIAFEPHPATFVRLKALASARGFEAIQAGCGSAAGESMLYDYASDDGSQHASLYRDVIEGLRESVSTHHAVSIVSLDDFIGNRALAPVDLLKIDVEGNELEVLRGARQSLQKGTIQAIQFEFNEMNLVSRVFFKDFLDMLRGYRLFRLLPRGMLPVQPYHPVLHELFGYQNIVAFRKGATAPGLSFPEERDLL